MASPARPRLWMFAGPNGSGKSTFYKDARILEGGAPLWIINPDLLTSEIAQREELEWLTANAQALDRIKRWLEAAIEMYKPVGVETVLASDKYLAFIDRALRLGFEFRLIYVALNSPTLHIERVRKRVAEGGHGVDEQKIVSRRTRSFDNLERVLPKASFAQIWDNSGASPRLIAAKAGAKMVMFDPTAIPELTDRFRAAAARS